MPAPEPGQRWGIIGGLFDPVHLGHLNLASEIKRRRKLAGVLFVPAFDHPHRPGEAKASFEDRLEMVKLATRGVPDMTVSEIERTLPRPNYTLDTVRALRNANPGVEFDFIVGADNLSQLPTWHRWRDLLEEITVVAGARPGASKDDLDELVKQKVMFIPIDMVDISSTAIRGAVADGVDLTALSKLVPEPVAAYIIRKRLYL